MSYLYLDLPKPLYGATALFTNRVAALTTMFTQCEDCESLFGTETELDFHREYKCTEVNNNE